MAVANFTERFMGAVGLRAYGVHGAIFFACLSMFCGGLCLYALRRMARSWYGLCELTFAVGVLFVAIYATLRYSNPAEAFAGRLEIDIASRQAGAAMIAAVYLIVRALDNIGEGLKPGSQAATLWARWFPQKFQWPFVQKKA